MKPTREQCEEAFDAWSETWSDTAVWHGPAFWEVWKAAWSAAYAELRGREADRRSVPLE